MGRRTRRRNGLDPSKSSNAANLSDKKDESQYLDNPKLVTFRGLPDAQNKMDDSKKHWLEYASAGFALVAALGAISAAYVSALQWDRMGEANNISDKNMKIGQRAFIVCNKAQIVTWGGVDRSVKLWKLSAIVENAGNTPTRNFKLRNSVTIDGNHKLFSIQDDFKWDDRDPDSSSAIVGPKSEVPMIGYYTSGKDLEAAVHGLPIEIAGVATYKDIFNEDHRTEFCFSVRPPPVDFENYPIGQQIVFTPMMCPKHNCADDDCKK